MHLQLPNNGFGLTIMLTVIFLIAASSFALPFWFVSSFAPWWVALPISLLASIVMLLLTVKYDSKKTP